MRGIAPVVVKLGGSFAFSEHLRDWIEALAACAGQVVIVPGAVRLPTRCGLRKHEWDLTTEPPITWRCSPWSNTAARWRASTALYRRRIRRGDPTTSRCRASSGVDAGADGVERERYCAVVGCHVRQLGGLVGRQDRRRSAVPRQARQIHIRRAALKDLIAAGIVDEAFALYLKESAAAAFIFGPSDHEAAVSAIRSGAPAGIPVE